MASADISERLQIAVSGAFKWRKRYQQAGLQVLKDLPPSGQPRKLTQRKIKDVLTWPPIMCRPKPLIGVCV